MGQAVFSHRFKSLQDRLVHCSARLGVAGHKITVILFFALLHSSAAQQLQLAFCQLSIHYLIEIKLFVVLNLDVLPLFVSPL